MDEDTRLIELTSSLCRLRLTILTIAMRIHLAVVLIPLAAAHLPDPANLTNAEALRRGVPLPRPRAIPPRCIDDGCDPRAEWERQRLARQGPGPSNTVIPNPNAPTLFAASCLLPSIQLTTPPDQSNHVLSATCNNQLSAPLAASINLGACLSFDRVTLSMQCPGRSNPAVSFPFAGNAVFCFLFVNTAIIQLSCYFSQGAPAGPPRGPQSIVNLNNCVGNFNGQLACVKT
ncbi:hypothetical protein Q8F55_008439 [Vanrija albida]|uniref:Cyanovirin-N domain-containing protein n=1 Tax=Vanrija albida TaxID=181172 RepID=A0ABR3PQU0_9TREE